MLSALRPSFLSGPWTPVLVKALATALVVTLASVVAEAAGPIWGALAASLPVSAGPTYVFLAMQHDRAFVAASALGGLAANAATMGFLAVYARRAGARLGPHAPSRARVLGPATAVWFALALASQHVAWTAATATLLNVGAFALGLRAIRGVPAATPGPDVRVPRRWFDLPLRAAAVALFVVAVVVASAALGPAATGTAASFPVVFTVVFLVLHARLPGTTRALLAATALRAMGGFGLMLLVLHLAVVPWGAPAALSLALLTTLAWSAGLLRPRGQSGARPARIADLARRGRD